MTKETLSMAINEIDTELIDNALAYKKKKSKVFKYAGIAAVFVFLVAAIMVYGNNKLPTDHGTNNGGDFQSTAHEKVTVIGNGYSDEQIEQYVNEIKASVALAVAAEYGDTDEIKILTKGYNHASLGKKNVVDRDYLTLPVIVNNSIVATVVIYNVDGELSNTICVGGENWGKIDSVFKENPDTELVFAYAGGVCEMIITPDNKIYEINPGGKDFLDAGEDWYSLLKTPFNTFSSNNFDSFVSVFNISSPLG